MNFTNSGRVQLDRYDAHSLKLISSSDMSFSESMWTNFQKSESVLFSFRGEKVAVQNHDDEIRVYETLSGKLVKHLEVPNLHGIQGMAISPDGNSLAYATRKRPFIEIHDLLEDRHLATLKGHNMVLLRINFSPDGKRLVSSSIGYNPILLWDTIKWRQVTSLPPTSGFVTPVAHFLGNGESLVIKESSLDTAGGYNIRVLNASPLTQIQKFKNGTGQ